MKYISIILLVLCFYCEADAQEGTKNSHAFSLGMGINRNLLKDEFHSPFTYKANNLSLMVGYQLERQKGGYYIETNWSSGKMQSAVSVPANHSILSLQAFYLANLKRIGKFSILAGGGLSSFAIISNYNPEISNATNYATAGMAVTVSTTITYHFNKKNSLSLYLNLPVIGVIYRPDYPINDKTLTDFHYLGKNLWGNARLEFSHKLSDKISLFAAVQLSYFSFHEPRRIAFMQKNFFFGLKIKR